MSAIVTIITLNYNQNDYTIKCIESILMSEFDNYYILLVDNGSTQKNYQDLQNNLPKSDKIILHRIEQNRGYVGGINYGLKKGADLNSDYFLIMNNDTIIDKYAITELVNTCTNYSNKAIVTGKVYYFDDSNRLQDIGYAFKNKSRLTIDRVGLNELDSGQYNEEKERDLIDDVFWLFPSDLHKKIGGYSNYFWFNAEQADFALRAKKAGYKLVYTPKAKLWHKGSVSIGGRDKNPKLAYWHIQSTLIFRYLHLSRNQFLLQYIKITSGVFSSYIKALFLHKSEKSRQLEYSKAKLFGIIYFHKWLFYKNNNTGINPFDK
ncbi:MAG: glycosyltransferase family 2 protein [Melioribacteraceae bacterium]|nr:glycosyltransferase family 2 protein [Melioribacteraceae bacterium]